MINIANCKVESDPKRGPRSLILRTEGIEYFLEAETTSEKDSWKKAFEEAACFQGEGDRPHSSPGERSESLADSSSNSSFSSSSTTHEYIVIPPPKLNTKQIKLMSFLPPSDVILVAVPPIFEATQRKLTMLDKLMKPKLENAEEDSETSLNTSTEESEDTQ